MDRSEQMFLDRGSDSFLGEVISLVKIKRLHIDINDEFGTHQVRVEFVYYQDGTIPRKIACTGRSYGEALRSIREELRGQIGQ